MAGRHRGDVMRSRCMVLSNRARRTEVQELVREGEAPDPFGAVAVVDHLADRDLHRRTLLDEVADPALSALGIDEMNRGQTRCSGLWGGRIVDDPAFCQADAGVRRALEDRIAGLAEGGQGDGEESGRTEA